MNMQPWVIGLIPGAMTGLLIWWHGRKALQTVPGMDTFADKFLMGFVAVMCVLLVGPLSTWHFVRKLSRLPVPDAVLEHLAFTVMLLGLTSVLLWIQIWYLKRRQTQERLWLYGPQMRGRLLTVWCLGLITILGVVAPLSYLWLGR